MSAGILLSAFSLMCLLLSGWGHKEISSFKDFALAKNRFSNHMIVATIIATLFGGGTYIGNMEKAYMFGITPMVAGLFTCVQFFVTGYFFAEPLQRYKGAITIGDIFEYHYGELAKIFVGIVSVVFTIGIVIVQLKVLNQIIASFCVGFDPEIVTFFSAAIVVIYCSLGGIRAVVLTDCLQLMAMLLAVPVLAAFLVYSAGGISGCIEKTPVSFWSVPSGMGLDEFIGAVVGFSMGDALIPPVVQRVLMAKDGQTAKRTMIIGSCGYFVLVVCAAMIGIASRALMPTINIENSTFIAEMLRLVIPQSLLPLTVIGLGAVLVSTTDSYLNTSCISFVHDVVKPINPKLDDKTALLLVKFVTIVSGAGAIAFSLGNYPIYDLLLTVFNLWGPLLIVPFVGLLLGYIVSLEAFFLSSLGGGAASAIWMMYSLQDTWVIAPVIAGISTNLILFTVSYQFSGFECLDVNKNIVTTE